MTARVASRRGPDPSTMVVGLTVFAVAIVAVVNVPFNADHAEERGHVEASAIDRSYRGGECEDKRVYYSRAGGTLLVSCRLPETSPPRCGVLVFRVTENLGKRILPRDVAYNATVHVTECWKVPDEGYQEWARVDPSLRGAIGEMFGAP